MGINAANRFNKIVHGLLTIRGNRKTVPLTTPKLKLAFFISRIFGPIPLLFLLWFITAINSGIGFWKALWVYPLILFLALLIPTIITSIFIASKKTDIEWQNIKDRKHYLLPVVISSLIILDTLIYFLTTKTLFNLSLLFSSIILAMGAIWVFFNFKISGHMVVATLTVCGLILFFGWQSLIFSILLIPILWARYTLKVHTLPELLAGVALPTITSLLAIVLFGWPNL